MTDVEAVRDRLSDERQRLQALQRDLAVVRDEDQQDDLSELSSVDQHPADVGTETFERERDLSTLEQVEAELAEVAAAFERLDAGTYGTCEACGRPIGEERLQALPFTRFCVQDQQRVEADGARPTGSAMP